MRHAVGQEVSLTVRRRGERLTVRAVFTEYR